jgi:hypothetical protein
MFALVANFSNLATLYKSARAGVDDAVDAGVKFLSTSTMVGTSLCSKDGSALSLLTM